MTPQQVAERRTSSGTTYVPGNGPYSGVMAKLVGYVPPFGREFVIQAGGMAGLLARILWSAVRHPVGYWGAVLDDIHETAKRSWFPVAASLGGFLILIGFLAIQFFGVVGAEGLAGPVIFLYSVRTFTPWVIAIVVAGIIGAALTTDIGTREVREELDAMKVMGIDPVREIALPRVISLTLITMLLTAPATLVVLVSLQLAALFFAQMPASVFYSNVFTTFNASEVVGLMGNMFLAGLLIGAVCSYKGFNAAGGPTGLGRAVNQAVVVSFLGVFVLQLLYQGVALGLQPEFGQMR